MAGYELYTELKIPTRQTWTFAQTIYDEFCNSVYGSKTIEQGINTLIPTSPSCLTIVRNEYPALDTQVVNLNQEGSFRFEYSFDAVVSNRQKFHYALYVNNNELYRDWYNDYPSPVIKVFFRKNAYSRYASMVVALNSSQYPLYVDRRTHTLSTEYWGTLYNALEQLVPTVTWQSVPLISGKGNTLALSTLNDKNSGNPVTTSDTSKFNIVSASNVSNIIKTIINA